MGYQAQINDGGWKAMKVLTQGAQLQEVHDADREGPITGIGSDP